MSLRPSHDSATDLRVFTMFETLLNCSGPFITCSLQVQGITAPPPTCSLRFHFCVVGGLLDVLASPVINLIDKI